MELKAASTSTSTSTTGQVQVQVLTLHVQVRVQVLWICTRVQLEYKYKYQVQNDIHQFEFAEEQHKLLLPPTFGDYINSNRRNNIKQAVWPFKQPTQYAPAPISSFFLNSAFTSHWPSRYSPITPIFRQTQLRGKVFTLFYSTKIWELGSICELQGRTAPTLAKHKDLFVIFLGGRRGWASNDDKR